MKSISGTNLKLDQMSDLELAIYQVDITPDTNAPVRSIEFSSKTTVIIRFCHVGTVCVLL